MIPLDEVLQKTKYVIVFHNNYRMSGTYAQLKHHSSDEVKKFYRDDWENQPDELKDFYKAFDYAIYELNRQDLIEIKNFYEAYVKNPTEFIPKKVDNSVLLHAYLTSGDIQLTNDVMIENYDGLYVGSAKAGCIMEALEKLDINFEISRINKAADCVFIIIQSDNMDNINDFIYEIKVKTMEHDWLVGDGKYSIVN